MDFPMFNPMRTLFQIHFKLSYGRLEVLWVEKITSDVELLTSDVIFNL